ncbi:MAG: PEP-CTERM sorting domain-containing protein [Planctomycetota bacterium]
MKSAGMMCALAVCAGAACSANAGIVTTDPGLYTTLEGRYDARIRLDGGNSQTWKTAVWNTGAFGGSLITTSGNQQNAFNSGVDYDFELGYTASTGALSLSVFGANNGDVLLNTTQSLSPGFEFGGFRYFIKANSAGITTVSGLEASLDGGTPVSLSGLSANGFAQGPTYFFDSVTDELSLTGSIRFDFAGLTANQIQGERFAFDVILLQGVPAPSTAALLGVAGLAATRRRR